MRLFSAKYALAALMLLTAFAHFAAADQPLGKMRVKSVSLTFGTGGYAVLRMEGTAPELGNCTCYGEVDFVPGEEEGALDGLGVVAFTAADGDVLVGVIAVQDLDIVHQQAGFEIHWRDAVTFRDGTTVESTGRFVDHRPPGIRRPLSAVDVFIVY